MSLCLWLRDQNDDSALKSCAYLQCLTSVELIGTQITSDGLTYLILDAHALLNLKVWKIQFLNPCQLSHAQHSRRTNVTHISLGNKIEIPYRFVSLITEHCPKMKRFNHGATLSPLEFVSFIIRSRNLDKISVILPMMQVDASCFSAIADNCKFLSKLSLVYFSNPYTKLDSGTDS